MNGTDKPETAARPALEPSTAPHIRVPEAIPIIGSGSTVMYPQQLVPVLATETRDISAIDEAATSEGKLVGIFAQKAVEEGRYEGELYKLGTAATIIRMAKAPDGSLHAILQGVTRIRLLSLDQKEPWLRGRVAQLEGVVERSLELEAMQRDVTGTFQRVVNLSETLPKELAVAVGNMTDPSALADFIAANLHIKSEERQAILDGRVGCFILTQGRDPTRWQYLKLLALTLDEMERVDARTGFTDMACEHGQVGYCADCLRAADVFRDAKGIEYSGLICRGVEPCGLPDVLGGYADYFLGPFGRNVLTVFF